ncbi:hypothetical protein P6F26_13295 [Roseibacterium sp. SDUM158017]|uniref:hypothetical protein n=1 Tax=Roseicyclus salinarum TaxID=3036773 RepID=UPI0024158D31|nr:hypothetical protein [Roseibacterium sp. SDUM158017]MDG4649414.1 hypothetical protein [Roseibacterium sp. SDUM158017]
MTRIAHRLAPLAIAALGATNAQAQTTDVATLLQSVENCLAWKNEGFPVGRTPFAGGFTVVEALADGGRGVYREDETGFEITLRQEGDTAFCESTAGTVAMGEDGHAELRTQLRERVEDGRAVRLEDGRYAFCAGPPGLLSVRDAEGGGATFVIEFNTDAALDAAGGCGN